jgi:hypothetical protein
MANPVKTHSLFHSARLNVYLVRYSAGHRTVPHVGRVYDDRLYKFNCMLMKPKVDGEFHRQNAIFTLFGRFIFSGLISIATASPG